MVNAAIAISQEQKQYQLEFTSFGGLNSFFENVFGKNLIKGAGSDDRIGQNIFLKGVRVEWWCENKHPIAAVPSDLTLHLLMVKNPDRAQTVANKFYVDGNGVRQTWASVTDKRDHEVLPKNTSELVFYSHKKKTIVSPARSFPPGTSFRSGKYYVPIKEEIVWEDTSSTIPYPDSSIVPNIAFCGWLATNQTLLPVPSSYDFKVRLTYYFRE